MTGGLAAALVVALTTGLLGSVGHCLGMCGGFCVAIGAEGRSRGSAGLAMWGYHLGRTLTYGLLGAAFGALGGAGGLLEGVTRGVPIVSTLIMVLAGLVMVYAGLSLLGWLKEGSLTAWLPKNFFAKALGVRAGAKGRGPFVFGARAGAVLGLLPCGLLFAAEAQAAATASALTGALVMVVFAQGTFPALFAGSTLVEKASVPLRRKFHTVAALVLIAWGVFTVVKPVMAMAHAPGDEAAQVSCH